MRVYMCQGGNRYLVRKKTTRKKGKKRIPIKIQRLNWNDSILMQDRKSHQFSKHFD